MPTALHIRTLDLGDQSKTGHMETFPLVGDGIAEVPYTHDGGCHGNLYQQVSLYKPWNVCCMTTHASGALGLS